MAPQTMPVPFSGSNADRIPLVAHTLDGEVIGIRQRDGYVNATAMCKAAGREWKHYNENKTTAAFLAELSREVGIPTSELIQSVRGGNPDDQGTWVHPQVATHLAQWLSPRFAVRVSQWVYEWLTGKAQRLPFHLRRYVINQPNVPDGCFSVLTEMIYGLVAPLEMAGYELPETIWPDISEGILFARYLREEHGIDTAAVPTYWHVFEDGRAAVRAKAYPNDYLALFRGHFTNVWLRQRAREYFLQRDPAALRYVDLALPAARQPGMLPLFDEPPCRPAKPVVRRPWYRR